MTPTSVDPNVNASDTVINSDQQTPIAAVNESSVENDVELDIAINNVVSSFSVRCHLNLNMIARNGVNVEYHRSQGMLTMKLRKPNTTASMWCTGKVTVTGAVSEVDSKIAARRYARLLQKMGFKVRFSNFRVVNVLGTCHMPFAIRINLFSAEYKAEYEPELHPGVTYRIKDLRATVKIFSTGSVTVTAPSIDNVQLAIHHVYPMVYNFRSEKYKQVNDNESLN